MKSKKVCLDIEVKNDYNNYLYRIFQGIDLSNYIWDVIHEDLFYDRDHHGNVKQDFFGYKEQITNEEFIKCISRKDYYMIFVDLKAYPIGSTHTEINVYKDFVDSNCCIVFICYDSSYINFYCKNSEILEKVYNNCLGDEFEKVEWRTEAEVKNRSLVAF